MVFHHFGTCFSAPAVGQKQFFLFKIKKSLEKTNVSDTFRHQTPQKPLENIRNHYRSHHLRAKPKRAGGELSRAQKQQSRAEHNRSERSPAEHEAQQSQAKTQSNSAQPSTAEHSRAEHTAETNPAQGYKHALTGALRKLLKPCTCIGFSSFWHLFFGTCGGPKTIFSF